MSSSEQKERRKRTRLDARVAEQEARSKAKAERQSKMVAECQRVEMEFKRKLDNSSIRPIPVSEIVWRGPSGFAYTANQRVECVISVPRTNPIQEGVVKGVVVGTGMPFDNKWIIQFEEIDADLLLGYGFRCMLMSDVFIKPVV